MLQVILIFLDCKGFWDWIINYIGNASDTKMLEKGEPVEIQFKRKDNKWQDHNLKDTIIRMVIIYSDEDENKYHQVVDIVSGISTISKPELLEEEI